MNHVYVYEAICRKKDNPGNLHITHNDHNCIREVCRGNPEETIAKLVRAIQHRPGVWRIYRSVNKRDVRKAEIELAKLIIDRHTTPGSVSNAPIDSLWKTVLMQPHNKAERLFLLDVDTNDPDSIDQVFNRIYSQWTGGNIQIARRTPNGNHFVVTPFDPRLVADLPYVGVKKDALVFVKLVEVR